MSPVRHRILFPFSLVDSRILTLTTATTVPSPRAGLLLDNLVVSRRAAVVCRRFEGCGCAR